MSATAEKTIPTVRAGTDKHPDEVQDILAQAGFSRLMELTPKQAQNLRTAMKAGEVTPETSERKLRDLINAGTSAAKGNGQGRKRSKYTEAERTVYERAVKLSGGTPDEGGPKYPLTIKQVHRIGKLVAKAGGDPIGVVGTGKATLRKVAKGEKVEAEQVAGLREWLRSDPELRDDRTMYARKAAAIILALAEQQ